MATELKLPDVGEDVKKATVIGVSIKEGQTISQDDVVIEIETDKASLEVPAEAGGTVKEVRVSEGDEIAPGDVIAVLEGEGGGEKKEEKKPAKSKEPEKKEEPEEEAAEEPEEEKKTETPEKKPARAAASKSENSPVRAAAPPSVRRLARELGVEIADVEGSGDGGRITDEDVKRHVREMLQTGGARPAGAPARGMPSTGAIQIPDFEKYGPVRRERLSGIRATIAQRMTQSWTQIPHVHHFEEADITLIETARKEYNGLLGEGDTRVSLTAILFKIVGRVLQDYPDVSASLDLAAGEVVYKDFCHIAMAVDTPRGLMVPVIRDVDRKTIPDIADDIADAAKRARDGKLKREDMQGGVFTVTNVGGIGGVQFTPIINPPDVAILGVSRGQLRVVMQDGKPVERLVLPLALGYDHRMIDGATAARFMRDLAGFLSNPVLSLIGL